MPRRRHTIRLGYFAALFFLASCSPTSRTPEPTLPPSSPQPSATQGIETSTAPTPSPEATPTPTPLACLSEGGRITEQFLSSDILPQRIEYYLYLPPCYDQQPAARYPVLYMIHGQSYRHDQWINLGLTAQADAWIAAGEIAPLIIVMPRDRVWTPPSEDLFGQGLVEELIPYIDATYRTKAEREFRAVGGLSRGAAWAIHLGLNYMDVFGAVGGHSLPVFWEDAPKIPRILQETPVKELPRIYVDIGDRDRAEIMESTLWFVDLLARYDVPHEWHLFVGYHEEAYWAQHVPDYLAFYSMGW
jgi:enterochelin esterase-like enzyme